MDTWLIFHDPALMRWRDGMLYCTPIIGFEVHAVRTSDRKIRRDMSERSGNEEASAESDVQERVFKKNF